jgi:hypothetical protein
VRPDSAEARRFAALVDALLADAPRYEAGRDELRRTLTSWRDERPALEALIARSPDLQEAAPLAADLAASAGAGLEAIDALASRTPPQSGWGEARLALLEQAARPTAEVRLAIVPAVRRLVIAAGAERN